MGLKVLVYGVGVPTPYLQAPYALYPYTKAHTSAWCWCVMSVAW